MCEWEARRGEVRGLLLAASHTRSMRRSLSAPRMNRVGLCQKLLRRPTTLSSTLSKDTERSGKSRSMSKRDSDGDVLTNRLALGLAKNQKLLASWMGEKSEPSSAVNDAAKPQEEDDDLKQDYAHDRYRFPAQNLQVV